MATVDEKIVKLSVNNAGFESKLSASAAALQKLNSILNRGIGGGAVAADAKQISNSVAEAGSNMDGLAAKTSKVSAAFDIVKTAAGVALGNLATMAISSGASMIKALTMQPLLDGIAEYNLQMGSVQTILSNTKSKGEDIKSVTKALDELNAYADLTIYNFGQMTSNIGKFTAAGVGLDDSVASIKGIANLAALSGANSEEASRAMYQLSQAIASGTVKLMDWNSVVNAGMGGEVFQEALKRTARAHGQAVDEAIEKQGSFRESLSEGWLTAEVMIDTLTQLTGDLTEEQIRAMGYTEEEAKAIYDLGKTALNAATEFKTWADVRDAAMESLGSGWAKTWQIIFGDYEESKALWTAVGNAITGVFDKISDSRNNFLQGWKDLGGRTALINGLKNAVTALSKPLKAIGSAFGDIFKGPSVQNIVNATKSFEAFTKKLIMSDESAEKLKRTFAGVFAIFHTGFTIFSEIAKVVGALAGSFIKLLTGLDLSKIGNASASFGDFLVKIDKAVSSFHLADKAWLVLSAAFAKIKPVLEPVKSAIQAIGEALKTFATSMRSAFKSDEVSAGLSKVKDAFTKLKDAIAGFGKTDDPSTAMSKVGNSAKTAAKSLTDAAKEASSASGIFDKVKESLGAFGTWLSETFSNTVKKAGDMLSKVFGKLSEFMNSLGSTFKGGSWSDFASRALGGILTLLAGAGIAKAIKSFADKFSSLSDIGDSIKEVLEGVQGALQAFQNNLNAKSLMSIAIAVGILAASLLVLSSIDSKKMMVGLGGLAAVMGELIGAFKLLSMSGAGAKTSVAGPGLLMMASSVLILAGACKLLASMDTGEIVRGTAAIGVLTAELVAAAKVLGTASAKAILGAASAVLLATAIAELGAVTIILGNMDVGTIVKGVAAIGVLVAEMVVATKALGNAHSILGAGTIAALSASMYAVAGLVLMFGKMDWDTYRDGAIRMGLAIAELVIAVRVLDGAKSLSGAAAVAVLSASMLGIAQVFKTLGSMDWTSLAKAAVAMGVAIAEMVVAVKLLDGVKSMGGATAILLISASMNVLARAVESIGKLSLTEIAKGLGAIAVYLAAVVVAAKVAQGSTVGLLAFAAAIAVLSPALLIFANVLKVIGAIDTGSIVKGLVTIAAAFAIVLVAAAGAEAVAVGIGVLSVGLVALGVACLAVGAGMALFGAGLTAIAASGAVAFPILINGISGLIALIPTLIAAVGAGIVALAETLLQGVIALTPTLVEALTVLVNGLCQTVIDTAPNVAEAFWTVVSSALAALANHAEEISTHGWTILTTFLNGMSEHIEEVTTTAGAIVAGFLQGIANNIGSIVTAGANIIINFLNGLATKMPGIVTAATNLIVNFLNGLAANIGRIIQAGANLIVNFLNGLVPQIPRIAEEATNVIIAFINAIADQSVRLARAGMEALLKFINGMTDAVNTYAPRLRQAGLNLLMALVNAVMGGIPGAAMRLLNSARQIGTGIVDGIKNGLSNAWHTVTSWISSMASGLVDTVKGFLGIHSPSRVFADLAQYIPLGMVVGMRKRESDLAEETRALAEVPVNAMNSVLEKLNDEGVNLQPTIAPVLDLSDVQKGAGDIQNLLRGTSTTAGFAASLNSSGIGAAPVTNEIHNHYDMKFEQNISAPKSLDAIDIARSTRGVLSDYERAVKDL